MKRVTTFECSDGERFSTSKLAKAHEAEIDLDKLLGAWFTHSSSLTQPQLRSVMVDNVWALTGVLSVIARRTPLIDEAEEQREAAD